MITRIILAISALALSACATPPPPPQVALDDSGRPLGHSQVDNINSIAFTSFGSNQDSIFNSVLLIKDIRWLANFDHFIDNWKPGNAPSTARIKDGELWFELQHESIQKKDSRQRPIIFGRLNDLVIKSNKNEMLAEVAGKQFKNPEIRIIACPRGATEFSNRDCLLAFSKNITKHSLADPRSGDRLIGYWYSDLDNSGKAARVLSSISRPLEKEPNSDRVTRAADSQFAFQIAQKWDKQVSAEQDVKRAEQAKIDEAKRADYERRRKDYLLKVDRHIKAAPRGTVLKCTQDSHLPAMKCAFPFEEVGYAHYPTMEELLKERWSIASQTSIPVETWGGGAFLRTAYFFRKD